MRPEVVSKRGLTDPEATFFERGVSRPIGNMHGLRCSAVICREVEDLASVSAELLYWPNALNRPEESVEGGGSTVASPDGEVLLRLPGQACGVGIFNLGECHFTWHPQWHDATVNTDARGRGRGRPSVPGNRFFLASKLLTTRTKNSEDA